MASRKRPEPPQHETYPGPGPGKVDRGTSGIHPVEQMVDAGIERIAREGRSSHDMTPHALDATPHANPELTPQRGIVRRTATHALARPIDIKRPGRLRWKGLDVSPEFKEYADRVARGEDLPPFEGRILAEPNSKFPWAPEAVRKESRRAVLQQVALWSSAAVVAGLLTWTVAVRLSNPPSQTFAVPPQPSTAVLSNRSIQPEASPSTAEPDKAADALVAEPERPIEQPPAARAASNPPQPISALRSVAPAPAPAPPQPARVAAPVPAPIYTREAPSVPAPQEAGRSMPVDIAAPGALREALGALLSARASGEAAAPGASSSGGAQSSAAPSAASPAPAQPSAPSASGAPTGAAGKEPSGEASTKGSLLVEKPSF